MHPSEVFVTVPAIGKPEKRPLNQFEFVIDRKRRKVVAAYDIFATRETIRVQTERLFTWWKQLELPDSSTGMTRDVTVVIEFEGTLAREEKEARSFLQLALDADFKLDALIDRLVTDALAQQPAALRSNLIATMREPDTRAAFLAGITGVLRRAGLPVARLAVQPLQRDQRVFLDFQDIPGTLAIRSSGSLEAHTVGYKARLAWGIDERHRNARLLYRGTLEGLQPGLPLSTPFVAGQVQPLEAWFRLLLAQAIAHHPWSDVLVGGPAIIETLRTQVSRQLGPGTGRVVEALQILPTPAGQARLPRRTLPPFREFYPVTGVSGKGLAIEHTLEYALKDRDRWVAQGSPHPEEALKPQVIEATRAFLFGKRFKDVVALYLRGEAGEDDLQAAIAARVQPFALSIGCSLVSNAVILSIPEKEFVSGRPLSFPVENYNLADPNLSPPMRLSAVVKLGPSAEAREAFARALTEQDGFEDRVRTVVKEAVRASLRRVNALSYYRSSYVNGAAEPSAPGERCPDQDA